MTTAGPPEQASGTQAAPLRASDPTRLGTYELLGRLGQGGMGTVYLGRDQSRRLVAIKVIRADVADDREFRARFRHEAANARRVARFCTAEVLDADPDAESPYLVTEFIEGDTLARTVATKGPLEPGNLERLAVGVAAALTAIHGAGIIHRDLKPSNVVLSAFGPRVIDFGIARAEDATTHLTSDLQQLGTPAFMAPEQIQGYAVSPKVDVFAWGGVVAYAATGRQAFGEGPVSALLYRAVHDAPDLNGVPEPLFDIVTAALEKDPANRPTAQELMLRLLGQPATASTGVTQAEPAVTQVLSGWKLPETPPRGSAPLGPGRAAGATAGTPVPAQGRPRAGGYNTSPFPPEDAHTQVAQPQPTPAGSGGGGGSGPGPTPDGNRKRWPIIAGVGAAVVAVIVAVAVLASGGGGGGGTGTGTSATATSSSASAATAPFVLPQSAQPVSENTLVYGSQQPDQSNVETVNADGSGLKDIISGLDKGQNLLPIFSKDRRTMVYYVPSSGKLVARAADSTGKRIPLFPNGAASKLKLASDARPSFSPDGTKIAIFATPPGGTAGLYVVTLADGATKRLVTPTNRAAADPAFSPDGTLVAYWARNPGDVGTGGGRLFTSPADGSGQPSELFAGDNADPSWSPNGQQIVFTRLITDNASGKVLGREISVVDADGNNRQVLTSSANIDQDPTFSPDGTQIAFSSERTGRRQIFIMNANGSNQHQLTHDQFTDSVPGWNWH